MIHPRKKLIFYVIIGYMTVLTGHVVVDVLNLASFGEGPRTIIWSSIFSFSMAFNMVAFTTLLYESLKIYQAPIDKKKDDI